MDDKSKYHPNKKDALKRSVPNNYRPITFLTMIREFLTAQIIEDIYFLIIWRLFWEEQKGCHKETRGVRDLPNIDQGILKESKTRRKTVDMAWISYQNVYGIVPQGMGKVAGKVIKFNEDTTSGIDIWRKKINWR